MSREPLKTPERHRGKFSWRVITAESKGSTFFMGWGGMLSKSQFSLSRKRPGVEKKEEKKQDLGKGGAKRNKSSKSHLEQNE